MILSLATNAAAPQLARGPAESFGWVEDARHRHWVSIRLKGGPRRLPALAADLVDLEGRRHRRGWSSRPAGRRARPRPHVPIVMTSGGDPVAVGLVASLARPGGNITGLATTSPELSEQAHGFLKQAVPGPAARRRALESGQSQARRAGAESSRGRRRTLGIELQLLEFRVRERFRGGIPGREASESGGPDRAR